MKLADVRAMHDLRPRERALQALELGEELRRGKVPKSWKLERGKPPPRVIREDTVGSKASMYLQALHGVRKVEPEAETGFRLQSPVKTAVGPMPEVVFTPRGRKRETEFALKKRRTEKVADLALRQLAVGLMDPDPLARYCSAFSYWRVTGATHAVTPVLAKGLESEDYEEFDVAAHCLGNMGAAGRKHLKPLVGPTAEDRPAARARRRAKPAKASLTLIVHGTWARDQGWYKPGGDFHTYVRDDVFTDTYAASDYFYWSGGYSDAARALAAEKLAAWCKDHPAQLYRFIAHSHGANVVNLATSKHGLKGCTLVHLSPPVRKKYLPEMANVSSGTFFTFRPTIDLVVALDSIASGGADQDYSDTAVADFETHRICAWAGHSKSHEVGVWKKKELGKLVEEVCP